VTSEEDHRHCKVCGRVCDVDDDTCSRACAEKRAQQLQSRRTYTYLLYGTIALLLIVFLSRFFV
jgi:predicted nucleic acid-binding Zn ribbon protein